MTAMAQVRRRERTKMMAQSLLYPKPRKSLSLLRRVGITS